MINKLRVKFILVSLAAVTVVLAVMMTGIFAVNYNNLSNRADDLLDVLISNKGRFPGEGASFRRRPDFTPETPYETRFFSVRLDANGNILAMNTGAIRAIDSDDAAEYARRAVKKGSRGFLDNYRFKKAEDAGGTLIVFVDCTRDLNMFGNFVVTGISVSLLGLMLVFVAVFFLSGIALAPVRTAMDRQKRFITDASHELKTPLTVIDANLDVLEMENGSNRWIDNAKEETVRLRQLCEGLVELSRMDEGKSKRELERFDLVEAVSSAVLPFESVIEADGRHLHIDAPKGIEVNADKQSVTRLVGILVDNAVKHSSGDGDIGVRVSTRAGRSMLEVINPAEGLESGGHPEFFERFWRSDESRSKETGGFGIGLSVAKAIAEEHRGKIFAESNGDLLRIVFIF